MNLRRPSAARPDLPRRSKAPANADGDLFSPIFDFLCVGGGSIFILIPLQICLLLGVNLGDAGFCLLLVALVANYPHFANSYQIFYGNFFEKLCGDSLQKSMRIRYACAGLVVPVFLLGFLVCGFVASSPRWLGRGANLMFFLVGWHYMKQGYGILIVFSTIRRLYFTDQQKSLLRGNAYAAWIFAWLTSNGRYVCKEMLGLEYFSFPVPQPIWWLAAAVLVVTTTLTIRVLADHARKRKGDLPWNGIIGYACPLYLWSLLYSGVHPIFLALVPAFHSLQYLLIVWKYELNLVTAKSELAASIDHGRRGIRRDCCSEFATFVALGIVLGVLGFVGVPQLLHRVVSYDQTLFGGQVFTFMAWIFLNVHHYFLDNVIWRRENPDMRKYLFT